MGNIVSNNSNSSSKGGIGFFGLLTITFVALKLTHNIDWSWFWVLSPSIFVFSLWVIVIIIAFIIAMKSNAS